MFYGFTINGQGEKVFEKISILFAPLRPGKTHLSVAVLAVPLGRILVAGLVRKIEKLADSQRNDSVEKRLADLSMIRSHM
jgi:hypothetical protein